ncbi:DUF5134 domain-containing protein [Amycolatopsis jiangsuensis]|uniref:Amino acid transporter n=1 Tax=Amycolatopsis jiangsuensis TaxID=1181879 RepID=A0A840IT40_9PSEU|nr:DUF5134 domain-containing protein [Amycolatopsis jiangsuensis]MBB4684144.1 amino acid transporter [Amycolatopsis jiangsuensis]
MITDLGLRWILTLLFAAAAAFCLYRCARRTRFSGRVSEGLHALMCAGMVTMAWPATMDFARLPQIVLFTAAAVWFAVTTGGHGWFARTHHTLMMAGMAWMVFAMPLAMAGMTGMTGMTGPMTGGEHAGMDMGSGMTMTGHAPGHVVVVAVALTVFFVAAGLVWLSRAIDRARGEQRPGRRTAGLATEGVMSLGMAVMTLTMV